MIYGCERVSTAAQCRDGNSLEDQVAALEKYGCQKIVKEAFTGKTMDRPRFLNLLEVLQEGDTLVVCKLDRFARTAIEGVQTVRELFERGVRVHILNLGLVENTLTGKRSCDNESKFVDLPVKIEILHRKTLLICWGKIDPINQECLLLQLKTFIASILTNRLNYQLFVALTTQKKKAEKPLRRNQKLDTSLDFS